MLNIPKTSIDWFRFRVKEEPKTVLEALRPMFGGLGRAMALKPLPGALRGYQQAAAITSDDLVLGRMDYGGDSQLGWCRVDVPGTGCEWVSDWTQAQAVEDMNGQLRRVDVALTTWRGEITHERVVEAHKLGRFTIRRPPELQEILSSDPCAGRTCNIGTRKGSDKFMRCYEKGWQMLANLPRSIDRERITAVDGFPPGDIYRCEVEFKAATKDIPWELIERHDEYFAGAYPFCADILPGITPDVLQRRPERTAQTSLALALENCRIQFGPTLYTALTAYGGDIHAIWDKVVGRTHNQALLESGVLLVDHE